MRSCSDALYRCGSVMSSRSVMKAFPRLCLPVVNTQRLHIVGDIRSNDKLVSQEKTYQQPCVGTLILSSTKSLSRTWQCILISHFSANSYRLGKFSICSQPKPP
ncbi:uncharacterized protein [Panulirus ornatus]|uniref:uncharacterized protein isoform X3 n=1 Tax=Panulirus ornatus TaxID=150431 RepID=UPI003A83E2F8